MQSSRLCPSAPASAGAILLGVVRADGSIAYLKDRMLVTEEFLQAGSSGREFERRFRFSSRCVEHACAQWGDQGCRIPSAICNAPTKPHSADLPHCSIRPRCRWFSQAGAAVCTTCQFVVTKNHPSSTVQSPHF
jgi:hypothetical protein